MAKQKKQSTRSIASKIASLNKKILSNRKTFKEKRDVEKEIRLLKKQIGKKSNDLYPSEIERLKKEAKYLSNKKSLLNGKDSLNKKDRETLFKIARRQIEVSKRLHPERHDRRRKDYKPFKIEKKKDNEKWKIITRNLPIYQVKSDFLIVADKNKKIKSVNIDGKEFSKSNWDRMYLYYQQYYSLVLNFCTDLRSGRLKDSDISFSTFRNSKNTKMKLTLNNSELSNDVNQALNS